MVKRWIVLTLAIVLLPIPTSSGQTNPTCADQVAAAHTAYDAGNITDAMLLSIEAETLCADDATRLKEIDTLQTTLNSSNLLEAVVDLERGARTHLAADQLNEAQDGFGKVLILARYLENRLLEGQALDGLGETYLQLDDYDSALDYLQQARTVFQDIGNRAWEAAILVYIGNVYTAQFDYDSALSFYNDALTIWRDLQDASWLAIVLKNIGDAYRAKHHFEAALAAFTESRSFAIITNNPYHEIDVLAKIAQIHLDRAQYTLGLEHYTEALTLAESLSDVPWQAYILNRIAITYQQLGQYDLALQTHQAALDLQPHNERASATTHYYMGRVYADQTDWQTALDFYQLALAIFEDLGESTWQAVIRYDIGIVYWELRDYPTAFAYFTDSLSVWQDSGDQVWEAATLYRMAAILYDQADYNAALTLFNDSLSIWQGLGWQDWVARVSISLAETNAALNLPNMALKWYTDALAIGGYVGLAAEALVGRGHIHETLGHHDQAIADYEAAVTLLNTDLTGLFLANTLDELFPDQWPYNRLAVLLADDPTRGLMFLDQGQALLWRSQLVGQSIQFFQDADLLARQQALQTQLSEAVSLAALLQLDESAHPATRLEAAHAEDAARQAYTDHLAVMRSSGGFLAQHWSLSPVGLNNLQKTLDPNTTLVIYGFSDPSSIAFVITKSSFDAVSLDVSRANLETLSNSAAYTRLIAPLSSHLNTSHLIIVSNPLLPFAAFQSPDDSALIDQFTITISPSTTTFFLTTQPNSTAELLVFAPALTDHPLLERLALQTSHFETTEAIYQQEVAAIVLMLQPDEKAAHAFLAAGSPYVIMPLHAIDEVVLEDFLTTYLDHRQTLPEAEALRQTMLELRVLFPQPERWANFVVIGR